MYRYITLILFSSLFSINKDLNETTLLFHLNHTTNDLSIINSEDRIVTNPELNHFFSKYNFSFVFHLCALKSADESMDNPIRYSRNNLIGGINIINQFCFFGKLVGP